MNLVDLDAQLVRFERTDGREVHHYVDSVAEASGVSFLCPACFAANGGPVGTHHVTCWFAASGIPDDARPTGGRWAASGSTLNDLSLSPSVFLSESPCRWHGWVTNGAAT